MIQEDIQLTKNLETEWDGGGDADTVTDIEALEQSIAVSAMQARREFAGEPSDIEELRGAIEAAIENNDNTRPPVTVTVDSIDTGSQTVSFSIETARVSLDYERDITAQR